MDNFNVWSFITTIINVLVQGAQSLWDILFYNINLGGIVEPIIGIIEFFGGEPPEWLLTIQTQGLNIITLGGISLGIILIVVIVKKIIPLL